MNHRIKLAAVAVLAVAALAACSGSDDSAAPSDDFNDADVTFAQDMIPHHRQAVVMADMVASRSDSSEVLDLAERIKAAQGPEIDTMTGWLESWDQDVPSGDGGMGGMDHSDMDDDSDTGPGMMGDDEMGDLEDSSADAFDRMFLTMMIDHHEGAVDMARTEQDDGKFPAAITLAEKIEKDQTAEIAEMRDLLGS